MEEVRLFPSPWDLHGRGYIFIYKFKKSFIKENGNVPEFLKDSFKGGFGAIMLVNYKDSNAGSYDELLFIPGKFSFNKKKLDTISKIYVSTMESVINGRENWGIPKEKADFKFEKIDEKNEKVYVSLEGNEFFQITLKRKKLAFPVSTKLLPFPLVQEYENRYYFTKFFGKGKGKFAKIKDIKINEKYFPNVSSCRPIMAIYVEPFAITFPEAKIQSK